jgi:hypothetical protein
MTKQSSLPQGRHLTCRRCGADAGGAVWCPRCGLNLRTRIPSPPAADPTTGSPPREAGPSRTPFFVGGALVAAAVAGVVLAIILSSGHAGTTVGVDGTPTASQPTPAPSPSPTVTDAPRAVSAAAMYDVLKAYAAAFSAEDLDRLRSLFAADLVRKNGSDPAQDLAGALRTYAGQFAQLSNPDYELSGLRYQQGVTAGEAVGTYRITDDNGADAQGQIAFDFTARDGSVLIDRLVIRSAP